MSGLVLQGVNAPPWVQYSPYPALIDPSGTIFVQSFSEHGAFLRLHTPSELPRTTASLDADGDGARLIHAESMDPAVKHTWRLDEGKWHNAVQELEIPLPPLTAGCHTLDMCAVNAVGLPDPTPVRFESIVTDDEVAGAEASGLDALLRQLRSGTSKGKERVAKALVDSGETTLPKLKALLQETKDENARWWFEAVIQQIEGTAAPTATPRGKG